MRRIAGALALATLVLLGSPAAAGQQPPRTDPDDGSTSDTRPDPAGEAHGFVEHEDTPSSAHDAAPPPGPAPDVSAALSTRLSTRPRRRAGVPSGRWCGGAPARVLPWRPGTKASQAAVLARRRAGRSLGRVSASVSAADKTALEACVKTGTGAANQCGAAAMRAAAALPSIRALGDGGGRASHLGFPGVPPARTCAVVGNAGGDGAPTPPA